MTWARTKDSWDSAPDARWPEAASSGGDGDGATQVAAPALARCSSSGDDPDRALGFALGGVCSAVAADEAGVLAIVPRGGLTMRSRSGMHVLGPDPARVLASDLDRMAASGAAVAFTSSIDGSSFGPAVVAVPLGDSERPSHILYACRDRKPFAPSEILMMSELATRVHSVLAGGDAQPSTAKHNGNGHGHNGNGNGNAERSGWGKLIGRSTVMRSVYRLVEQVAATDYPAIVQGESGTGKELIARAIHQRGRRAARAFVAENCAALHDSLLEAELFGYVKGAFTGADRDQKGLFEVADGGTLFLDEIGEMNQKMQKDLLRVLQEGQIRPVGGKVQKRVDVRIVCASNRDLRELVRERTFRADLFYRLNVMLVEMPPLRERRDDIPILVEHFLDEIAQETQAPRKRVSPDLMGLLMAHDWPGNVRELRNEVARMAALADAEELLTETFGHRAARSAGAACERGFPTLRELEQSHIIEALRRTGGNKTRAAQLLGVNKATIFRKLRALERGA